MERAELENAEVAGDDEEEVEGLEGDFSGGEGAEQNSKGFEQNGKTIDQNDKEDVSEEDNWKKKYIYIFVRLIKYTFD